MSHQIDTIIHLNTRLRTKLLRAIIARWHAGERDIRSDELYAQLQAAGEVIPSGAMAVVFDDLRMLNLIDGPLPERTAAISLHGDTRIRWLHPQLAGEQSVASSQ